MNPNILIKTNKSTYSHWIILLKFQDPTFKKCFKVGNKIVQYIRCMLKFVAGYFHWFFYVYLIVCWWFLVIHVIFAYFCWDWVGCFSNNSRNCSPSHFLIYKSTRCLPHRNRHFWIVSNILICISTSKRWHSTALFFDETPHHSQFDQMKNINDYLKEK